MARILIAGVGNIFLGDDGFGVEVARRLMSIALPDGVRVADFGIRGIHLAYELLDEAYRDVILIDAVSRGAKPGTVSVLDLTTDGSPVCGMPSAHGMSPDTVIGLVRTMVTSPPRFWLIGCEPERLDEALGLSDAVGRAIDVAIDLVQRLAADLDAGSTVGVPSAERSAHA